MITRNKPESNPASPVALGAREELQRDKMPLSGNSFAFERRLLAWILGQLGDPPLGFELWDGHRVFAATASGNCQLKIRDRGALWRLITNPEFEFPELYAQGRIQSLGDLVEIMDMVQQARHRRGPQRMMPRLLRAAFRPHSGSLSQAKQNIYHHYDLGNAFYQLWLDRQMLYTCAYFPSTDVSLEQAQVAKMDRVCRKLRLQPGEQVVEAGCGWGALAIHMARHFGARVRAFNISKSQLSWARQRAVREGVDDLVEFVEGDYRDIDGQYDVFVSVGMLEHVGQRHYKELGRIMTRCLPANGRGLIHSIGTDRPAPLNPWIERRIFPGACPPSLGEMMQLFEPNGFSVLDVENLRLHYALTLEHWLGRFEAARDQVLEMYDAVFERTWRFYLASSKTAFTAGNLQLFQVTFARSGCNQIPWTRAHLCDQALASQDRPVT